MNVYLVGVAGAAPRLQLLEADHAQEEVGAGEVCVPVPSVGAWQISADGLSATELLPSEATQWMEIRRQRDSLLTGCDWTQLPDVPEATRAAWVIYRQALRDLTETYATPAAVVWPQAPAGGE